MDTNDKKPGIKIDFDGLWLVAFLLFVFVGSDSTPKERAKNPHSLGAAITCAIGGPSFCPKVQP